MSNTTSAARPKRAAEDFARSSQATTKKPRFDPRNPSTLAADAPEEDAVLDADVIGKSGAQVKRNAVNIDGYDSDSDNDNFDARAAEREREKRSQAETSVDEEENDMFAELAADFRSGGEEDESSKGKGKKAMTNGGDGEDEEEEEEEDIYKDPQADMFADIRAQARKEKGDKEDGEEEDAARDVAKKKDKNVRFLGLRDIKGQVMKSVSGKHVPSQLFPDGDPRNQRAQSEESSSGSDEDRDRVPENMDEELAAEIGAGGKRKHAPRLDAFNLKEEQEEGKFDTTGNYVRKAADPDAVNDNWLEGVTKKDMRKAKEAHEKRQQEQRQKAMADDSILTSDLISTLLTHLEPTETPLETLQRMNQSRSKASKVPKWKQKRLKAKGGEDETMTDAKDATQVDEAEAKRKSNVEAITGAADALYTRGHTDIYETERELLLRQYQREAGQAWVTPQKDEPDMDVDGQEMSYEYRWNDGSNTGEIHGPYDVPTMKAWNEAGYFSQGVEFRRVGGDEWSRVLDV